MAVKVLLMCKRGQIGILLVVAAFVSTQLAAETKVPNEFTSGTPAKASEVNENFSNLNSKIEAISKPESSYSVLSTETLDSGLVRTKLYAYEQHSASRHVAFHDTDLGPDSAFEVRQLGVLINALGQFQQDVFYREEYLRSYFNSGEAQYAHTCPDGSQMARRQTDIAFNLTFISLAGSFVLSNRGGINTGVFSGCPDGGVNKTYYYLEGFGSGVYSCVSRVAYYGAAGSGGFTDKTSPSGSSRLLANPANPPYAQINSFDRTLNGEWGTYYLEIDAPAGCITLSGPAPVEPTPAPDEDSPDAEPAPTPEPADEADNTTSTTTSE